MLLHRPQSYDANRKFGRKYEVQFKPPVGLIVSVESPAPASQRSWVGIPFKPEFFSGFSFITAKVLFIHVNVTETVVLIMFMDISVNVGRRPLARENCFCSSSERA